MAGQQQKQQQGDRKRQQQQRRQQQPFLLADSIGGNRTFLCGEKVDRTSIRRLLLPMWGVSGTAVRTFGHETPAQVARIADTAEAAYTSCAVMGGRYWEIDHHVGYTGLCNPWRCSADQIRREILPIIPSSAKYTREGALNARVEELVSYGHLKLDFAFIGIDRCGSTSLRFALEQHPSLCFTKDVDAERDVAGVVFEDVRLLWSKHSRLVLPTRELVESFAESKELALKAKPHCKAFGNYVAVGYRSATLRELIFRVPGLKVVIVACDPVRRLEGYFARTCNSSADCSISRALKDPLYREWRYANFVLELVRSFGRERLFILYQEELMNRDSLNRLVDFLGVGPFPAEADFRKKYHWANRAQLTDFCTNASLARSFKGLMRRDYMALESTMHFMGVHRPKSLALRQDRCGKAAMPIRYGFDRSSALDA